MFPSIQKSKAKTSSNSKSRVSAKLRHVNTQTIRQSVSCPSADLSYFYRILPGNNTGLLFATLSKRPWLRPTKESKPKAHFIWEMYRNPNRYSSSKYKRVVLNHIENNACLVTKHGLYFSIKNYCLFTGIDVSNIIPLTFHLRPAGRAQDEIDNSEMANFLQYNATCSGGGMTGDIIWIMKPSSCSNRGHGIVIKKGATEVLRALGYSESDPQSAASDPASGSSPPVAAQTGGPKGYIVQVYMQDPLLIRGRKFDIRCFALLTLREGRLRAFMYRNGYVRTSGAKYNLKNLKDLGAHLTNDSVQKKCGGYGRHEAANKLTYAEWQEIVEVDYPDAPPNVVFDRILPSIRNLVRASIAATRGPLSQSCIKRSFELLGYDFMVDASFRPLLIEVNSNPSLEFSSPMLQELLSSLMENVFSVAVDKLMPPPREDARTRAADEAMRTINSFENKFEEFVDWEPT